MSEYFIDPSAAVNGNGAQSTPFNSWANCAAAVTIGVNDVFRQKSGTVAREELGTAFFVANGIVLSTYGGSAKASIRGSDIASGFSYNAQFGVWEKTIANGYNVLLDNAALKYTAWNTDLATTAPTMPDNSMTYSGTVLYIKHSGSPDGCEVSARNKAIEGALAARSNITVEQFVFSGFLLIVLDLNRITGLTIRGCDFGVLGGNSALSTQGRQVELWRDVDTGLIEDCTFTDAFLIALNIFQFGGTFLKNVTVRRNTFNKFGRAGAVISPGGTTSPVLGHQIYDNYLSAGGSGWSGNTATDGVGGFGSSVPSGVLLHADSSAARSVSGCRVAFNRFRGIGAAIQSRNTQGDNQISGNEIVDCSYGMVSRQRLVSAAHVDTFIGNVIVNASVAAHFVSGAADIFEGGAAATETLVNNLQNNVFLGCAKGTVNTTNANATVNAKNNIMTSSVGGTAFEHSTGTLVETKNNIFGMTAGKTLDGADTTLDPQLDSSYKLGNAALRTTGAYLGGGDFYGKAFQSPPSIGAVQYQGAARSLVTRSRVARSVVTRALKSRVGTVP